jgi:hypothetical protein
MQVGFIQIHSLVISDCYYVSTDIGEHQIFFAHPWTLNHVTSVNPYQYEHAVRRISINKLIHLNLCFMKEQTLSSKTN